MILSGANDYDLCNQYLMLYLTAMIVVFALISIPSPFDTFEFQAKHYIAIILFAFKLRLIHTSFILD